LAKALVLRIAVLAQVLQLGAGCGCSTVRLPRSEYGLEDPPRFRRHIDKGWVLIMGWSALAGHG